MCLRYKSGLCVSCQSWQALQGRLKDSAGWGAAFSTDHLETWNFFPLVSARRVMDSQLFISRDKLFRKKGLVKAFDRHWDLAGSVIAEFKMKSHSSATNISVLAAI